MSPEEGAWYSGISKGVPETVRVIEEGAVRTVIEAVFRYNESFICMRYKLPKKGTEIQVEVRVNWSEKSKMLKISIATPFKESKYLGQTAFGVEELVTNGDEVVAQKWVSLVSENSDAAISIVNDGIYGSDCCDGEVKLSLLRSPGYCAHPINDREIMPQDRFSPRIDVFLPHQNLIKTVQLLSYRLFHCFSL
jgi:alpha-mannosidase